MRGKSGTVVLAVLVSLCFASVGLAVVTPTPTPTPDPCKYCLRTDGACFLRPPVGCGAGTCVPVCPVLTPTPTPTPIVTGTPTATPTPTVPPTPTPGGVTFTPLGLSATPYTYRNQATWIQLRADRTWYMTHNAGHFPGDDTVPPALGTKSAQVGECLIYTDGSGPIPTERQLTCSYRDTTNLWENGWLRLVPWGNGELVGFSNVTFRPASRTWANDQHDAALAYTVITPQGFFSRQWQTPVPGSVFFPAAILDLHGQHYAYVGQDVEVALPWLPVGGYLTRWIIGESGGVWSDPAWPVALHAGMIGVVAADPSCDGCALGFSSDWPPSTSVTLSRSHDEGRSWSEVVLTLTPPAGYVGVDDCHVAVLPGGIADTPLWGVCMTYHAKADGTPDDDWSLPGKWVPQLWAQVGANVPGNFTTSPVITP